MTTPILRIGTRGSPLALAQTNMVRDRLAAAHPDLAIPGAIEVIIIKTTGDIVLDRPLAEIGGKGLFTKEIDEAMLEGRVDLAVHSMKDVATVLPDGIVLPCMLPREDPRDAFLCLKARSLADLPAGAVIGTSSLRRGAQILHRRPDLKVAPLRGNVQTRLRRLEEGVVDATLLALAGLKRLGLADQATAVLATEDLLPAVAQGAVGITCRDGDGAALERLAPLSHADTVRCVEAERAFLTVLDGSCRTPIAGLAEITGDGSLWFRGMIVQPDGRDLHFAERRGAVDAAVALACDAAHDLLARSRAGGGGG
ncbi:MAG: hydroxymethylbilane synthase [Alphaproteobacteria bacterium]